MGDRLQLLQIAKSKLQSLSIDEAQNTQYNSKYANLIKTTLQKKKKRWLHRTPTQLGQGSFN